MQSSALVLLLAATAAAAVAADDTVIVIESSRARADAPRFHVRLDTGVEVAGVAHEIAFPPGLSLATRFDGRPRCAPNEAINKGASPFRFLPTGCVPGESCTGLHALVLAIDNVDPIPSGSELYACTLAPATPPGRYPLRCRAAEASDPSGERLDAACADGEVEVIASTVLAGYGAGAVGGPATLDVRLYSNEATTALAADLDVAPLLVAGASAPACAARDAGVAASFAYLPDGCTPGATCTGVRAALAAPMSFAHDAVLLTCGLTVPDGVPPGGYVLRVAAGSGTTASGAAANVVGGATLISVGPPGPTESPTPVRATPTPGRSSIEIGVARGAPGEIVDLPVTLHTGEVVGGVQNDVSFEPRAAILADGDGRPACTPHPSVDWLAGPEFSFQPPACVPGATCSAVRALLLAAELGSGIADGTVLYTCAVAIDPAAAGSIPLPCSRSEATTPQGQRLPLTCTAGRVEVLAPSPTPTVTPESSVNPQGGSSSDGCTVGDAAPAPWWLALAPALLLARTCRRRPGAR